MLLRLALLSVAVLVLLSGDFSPGIRAQVTESRPEGEAKPKTRRKKPREIEPHHRVALAVARDRAEVLHEVYDSTLHVMHRQYFRDDRAMVPARALEDVFFELERTNRIEARWIAVNSPAMSLNHEAETDFEKRAVKAITKGEEHIEQVEPGVYRRAARISLGGSCIKCHTNLIGPPPTTTRFAALVISIPLTEDAGEPAADSQVAP